MWGIASGIAFSGLLALIFGRAGRDIRNRALHRRDPSIQSDKGELSARTG
jgi:hypothetical protein